MEASKAMDVPVVKNTQSGTKETKSGEEKNKEMEGDSGRLGNIICIIPARMNSPSKSKDASNLFNYIPMYHFHDVVHGTL